MSNTTSVKRSITRSLNTLKDACQGIEDQHLFTDNQNQGEDWDPSCSIEQRKQSLLAAQQVIETALESVTQKWEQTIFDTGKQTDPEATNALIDEYQAHWKNQDGDAIVLKAKDLVRKLQSAQKQTMDSKQQSNKETIDPVTTLENPRENFDHNPSQSRTFQTSNNLTEINPHVVTQTLPNHHESIPSTNIMTAQPIRLPKFELPKFNGELESFPEFWDVFSAAVHNNNSVPNTLKFLHLKNCLQGDAELVIRGLGMTEDSYINAINLLHHRYHRPNFTRNALVNKLKDIKPATESAQSQRNTFSMISAIMIQLDKLEDNSESTVVMQLIRDKFPEYIRTKLAKRQHKHGTTWKTSQLLAALDGIIEQQEAVSDFRQPHSESVSMVAQRSPPISRTRQRYRSRSPSQESYRRLSKHYTNPFDLNRCCFCDSKNHESKHCRNVTSPSARRRIMTRQELCWVCFKRGHKSYRCRNPPCRQCGKDHHTSLCLDSRQQRQSRRKTSPTRREREYNPYRSHHTPSSRESSEERYLSRNSSRSPSSERAQDNHQSFRKSSPYPRRRVTFTNNEENTPKKVNTATSEVLTNTFNPFPWEEDITDEEADPSVRTLVCFDMHQEHSCTCPRLMATYGKAVNEKTGTIEKVSILLDTGSQHSYIREDTAVRLNLPLSRFKTCNVMTFGGQSSAEKSARTRVTLVDIEENQVTIHLCTRKMITTVCSHNIIPHTPLQRHASSVIKEEISIDILLGIDYYWKIVDHNATENFGNGLITINTRFGPVTSGHTRLPRNHVLITKETRDEEYSSTDTILSKLWDLETIGIHDDPNPSADQRENEKIINQFLRTTRIKDGRIYVNFPWKENYPKMADNKNLARRRLENQYEKYHNNPEVWKAYCDTFHQQLSNGIIEEVDENSSNGKNVYYLPHQVVTKDSETTKHRIVYDASSHYRGSPSLNDCIHQGPTILPDLCGILLRSRLHRYLITADVEKAFHQVYLHEDQRDATRFMWLKNPTLPPSDENIRIFRFTRVPFGINASPFLLAMAVKHFINQDKDNVIRKEILENIYVDNLLIGAKTTEECLRKQAICKETFKKMRMNLREFMSNSAQLMKHLPGEDKAKSRKGAKLLGIPWDPNSDTIRIPLKLLGNPVNTKRTALQALASTFDPMGFLSPLLVKAKTFLQDLWQKNYDWDTPLSEEDENNWKQIVKEIYPYTSCLPRCITLCTDDTRYELLVFSDASQRLYAAAAYLLCKSPKDEYKCNILMAKSRLAPIEGVTIPRLELMACYIAVKLSLFINKQLNIRVGTIRYFTDSQIALHWIHSNKPLKTFVKNRVEFIRDSTKKLTDEGLEIKFHFVNTANNPADCATRGLTAEESVKHMWWTGPTFVTTPVKNWPNSDIDFTITPELTEEMSCEFKSLTVLSDEPFKSIIPYTRTNNYDKLIKIIHFILKFLRTRIFERIGAKSRLRLSNSLPLDHESQECKITVYDLKLAELYAIRHHYRENRTELQNLLNKGCIKVQQGEDGLYRGVSHTVVATRETYLVPKIRQLVKSIISQCVPCKKIQGRPFTYPTLPDLPAQRVIRSRPFQNTGLDYFGPLLIRSIKNEIRKVWTATENLNTFWNVWQKEYLQALVEKHQQSKTYKFGAKTCPKEGQIVLVKQECTSRTEWPLAIILKLNKSKDGTVRSAKIRTSNKSEIPAFMQEPKIHGSWAEEVNRNPPNPYSEGQSSSCKSVDESAERAVPSSEAPRLHILLKKKRHVPKVVAIHRKPSSRNEQSVKKVAMSHSGSTKGNPKTSTEPDEVSTNPLASSSWKEYKIKKKVQEEEQALIRSLSGLDVSSPTALKTPPTKESHDQAVQTVEKTILATTTSTFATEERGTEELTTMQLQQAVRYLDNDYYKIIRYQAVQNPSFNIISEPIPKFDEIATRIYKSVQSVQQLTADLVNSFKKLAVFVAETNPMQTSHALLAAWIDELTHGVVAINIHKDKIYEEMLPNFTESAEGQGLSHALAKLNLNQNLIREILQSASGATAFAHKYIRTLQTYQLNQASRSPDNNFSSLDEDYLWGQRGEKMTQPFPSKSGLSQHLELWRATFAKELGIESARTRIYNRDTQQLSVGEQAHQIHIDESRRPPPSPEPGPSRSKEAVTARTQHPQGRRRSVSPNYKRKRGQSVGFRRDSPPRKQRPVAEGPDDRYSGCIFCSDRNHYSASCPVVYKLSRRREILFSESRCHLCIRRHLGECRSGRACTICGERSHHQAFCIQNRDIREIDIREPRQQFYASLVNKVRELGQ
ncbi:zinc knuckle [Ancylostoma duodenale]|uniref:Zinc knuckle n=1 Tax=Ancylostoma duodenale TaxID=51022 RepID=A0A0C2GB61_9BILA|nr:zinc knuckle [Ancylostoma duodenale]